MSKPGKVLKGLCKKLGVRLTVKRGKKRVYKSIKVLKDQCKRKAGKKKKVKRRRRSKFGPGPVNPATPLRESADAPTPGKLMSPPQWDDILPEDSSPSGVSPFTLREQRRRGRISAGPPPPSSFDDRPLSPISGFDSVEERQFSPIPFSLGDFGKKKRRKKVKRKKVKRKKVKRKRK